MPRFILLLLLIQNLSFAGFKDLKLSEDRRFSFYTLSYVKHLNLRGKTENFDNKIAMFGMNVGKNDKTRLLLGMFNNSQNNRCMLAGVSYKWGNVSKKVDFMGMYTYAGEFFNIQAFNECGSQGVYRNIKKRTGVGFAPYIYHGLSYKMTDYFILHFGYIIPTIAVAHIEFRF